FPRLADDLILLSLTQGCLVLPNLAVADMVGVPMGFLVPDFVALNGAGSLQAVDCSLHRIGLEPGQYLLPLILSRAGREQGGDRVERPGAADETVLVAENRERSQP